MRTDTVTLFLALLAVVAQVSVVAVLVAAAAGRLAPVRAAVGPVALWLAAVVALVCTVGSLWLSEGAGFPPCKLCWYQRIAMYPLVVVLGVAARRADWLVRRYVVPLAGLGALVSVYHVLVERFPSLESGSCDPLNPCSIKWVERFGYLTIPAMALSGFALIITLVLLATPAPEEAP